MVNRDVTRNVLSRIGAVVLVPVAAGAGAEIQGR